MSTFAYPQFKLSASQVSNQSLDNYGVIDTVINPHRRQAARLKPNDSSTTDSKTPNLDALIWFVRLTRQ